MDAAVEVVINLRVVFDWSTLVSRALTHAHGSTFNTLWKNVADNLPLYKTYPRLIGGAVCIPVDPSFTFFIPCFLASLFAY